jgi:hypothetical protein
VRLAVGTLHMAHAWQQAAAGMRSGPVSSTWAVWVDEETAAVAGLQLYSRVWPHPGCGVGLGVQQQASFSGKGRERGAWRCKGGGGESSTPAAPLDGCSRGSASATQGYLVTCLCPGEGMCAVETGVGGACGLGCRSAAHHEGAGSTSQVPLVTRRLCADAGVLLLCMYGSDRQGALAIDACLSLFLLCVCVVCAGGSV